MTGPLLAPAPPGTVGSTVPDEPAARGPPDPHLGTGPVGVAANAVRLICAVGSTGRRRFDKWSKTRVRARLHRLVLDELKMQASERGCKDPDQRGKWSGKSAS
ncbi:hypothetical protein Snoj_22590 [Streptomyces nojiriensis]|uniref:Transposase n=1 Tax=Streptomyces nojiriensis TaxID=66374 RepID=A0ABQ3SJP3_9ACTN|nr:hypothetical protein GCM10010205_59370 [Streptomyces nojiriensis]GHI68341.1 hypothetical protein Snoj_22590 [Streptomyces nojiriensis]